MSPIRVVIIDDEPIAIEVIRELILQLAPGLQIAGTAREGLEAVEKINSLQPDLVFMDVDMPLLNGYGVLKKLSYRSFYLVLTTGYETVPEGRIEGISTVSLSKPVDPMEFLQIINTVQQKIESGK
jgi:two-component system LytT family response regulator